MFGWSSLWGWWHGDRNSQKNTSWGESMEESGRGDDRNISRKLKGKVLNSCVTPAYLYGLETMGDDGKTTRETAILRE